MQAKHGVTYRTDYALIPAVIPADVLGLAAGSESDWVQWTAPWNADSLLKPFTHYRFFIPTKGPPHPSLTDVWITPWDAGNVFTIETLGSIADVWPRIMENYYPEAKWGCASLAQRALKGAETSLNADTGFRRHPQAFWYPTLSMTLEIKKLLPSQGVKWLFMRAQAKKIENGRMDTEVTIWDQYFDLVAHSNHICLVIDTTDGQLRKKVTKTAKL